MCNAGKGFAIAALVCGLMGMITFWVFGLGGIFGIVAIVMYCVNKLQPSSMAKAGFVCGIISVALSIPVAGCWLLIGIGSHASAQAAAAYERLEELE